jgi:hypothetical protein
VIFLENIKNKANKEKMKKKRKIQKRKKKKRKGIKMSGKKKKKGGKIIKFLFFSCWYWKWIRYSAGIGP